MKEAKQGWEVIWTHFILVYMLFTWALFSDRREMQAWTIRESVALGFNFPITYGCGCPKAAFFHFESGIFNLFSSTFFCCCCYSFEIQFYSSSIFIESLLLLVSHVLGLVDLGRKPRHSKWGQQKLGKPARRQRLVGQKRKEKPAWGNLRLDDKASGVLSCR